ncbi:dihydrofolate synthase/folylpolyglutamate synthase [Clostridium pascui]|uniref:bifunctional folylpolyglutamate synthase/dihydrofolate synthase n=1 Tax=Clostridium pascui TaxID=46609 RepID=UPI001959BDB0|nr:folylpolyglutamate synthase/dihydrofolate synthase family protein [Clostridium pascui]MBM7871795.1 dihydrofolate synthase/folylpolyglutamate synthase [Clostridium pascui]
MDYNEVMNYYENLGCSKINLGLERISKLLRELGSPDKGQKYIHIAGTNGKGSIANYTYNILMDAGYKVGIYTSPYLIKMNEVIKAGSECISDDDFARITSYVKNVIESSPSLNKEGVTSFEILTAVALLYFYEKKCDFVILEVGLGGRLDATNVIEKPLVSVISKIGYDHVNILGNEIEDIAREKAGIIKDNSVVVLSPQDFETVPPIIQSYCNKHDASLNCVNKEEIFIHNNEGVLEQIFDYKDIKNLKIKLLGKHQIDNAATAIEVILALKKYGFNIDETNLVNGLINTRWQCRLELISTEPKIFIDGAHNVDGINTVAEFFKANFKGQKIKFIFGVLKDKNYKEMLDKIAPISESIFTVSPKNERALDAQTLSEVIKEHNIETKACSSIEEAIDLILSESVDDSIICICGSLYYVGEARSLIMQGDFGIK